MQKIFLVLKKRIFAPNSKPEKYDNIRKDSDGDLFVRNVERGVRGTERENLRHLQFWAD